MVYVSATGATTVHNLVYAQRLGLWGGEDFPFATRVEFVQAIEAGGVAAMEVLARDLRSLGLYTARSLSYDGVEYEMLEHALTPEQRGIYDAYAGAFAIIHNNLAAAIEAANITGESGGTLNRQAKSAARSAFESAKQRFFGHLLTSMKTPTLIASIDADLLAGHSAVIQIVSTGEALMERRLSDALTGGTDFNDHRLICGKLDQVQSKYPDMVLLHGGSPKGAELIAAKWAEARMVTQVAFKPDWTKHAKAAPFKRNDAMLDVLPVGVLVFPGNGIQENLADKASRLGIPVLKFEKGA